MSGETTCASRSAYRSILARLILYGRLSLANRGQLYRCRMLIAYVEDPQAEIWG
jgi:hypothetical protein